MAAQETFPIQLTEEDIADMSSPQVYDRGEDYFYSGQVLKVVRRESVVHAEVQGSAYEPYQVAIEFDADGHVVDTDCTCPYWDPVCKHVVAVLLTLVNEPDEVVTRPALETLLEDRSPEELRQALIAVAKLHPEIVEDLEVFFSSPPQSENVEAPPSAPSSQDLSQDLALLERTIRAELRSAARRLSRGYDAFGEYPYGIDYERILAPGLDMVRHFLDNRRLEAAQQYLATAVHAWFQGLEDLDEWLWDEWGYELEQAAAHLDLCAAEVILTDLLFNDPKKVRKNWSELLADWDELYDFPFSISRTALQQGWDAPLVAAVLKGKITDQGLWKGEPPDWADDLAQARLNALERAERWQEYVYIAQAEGQYEAIPLGLVHLGQYTEALEEAQAVFPQLSIFDPDLWLSLAQALWDAGAHKEALQAARSGLENAPHPDLIYLAQLADWLKARAAEVGDPELMLEAAQASFLSTFRLADYQTVQQLAGERWPKLRQTFMRKLEAAPLSNQIEVYLYEGLVERAIQAYDRPAHQLYRGKPIFSRIAEAAQLTHPDWVIRHCAEEAAAIMNAGKAKYYDEAVDWLRKARKVYQEHNRLDEWRNHLAEIRAQHGRKYKLMELLQKAFPGEI